MSPVSQTIFDAESGNCLSASIAAILDATIDAVPNFAQLYGDDCDKGAAKWLSDHGLRFLEIGFADYETFSQTYFEGDGEYCILSGPSTFPDRAHAVVGRVNDVGGIDVAHDPIPGGTGPAIGWRRVRFIIPEMCVLFKIGPSVIEGPPEEIGTGLYRMADGEVVGGEPEDNTYF